jgi:hypothetical protein
LEITAPVSESLFFNNWIPPEQLVSQAKSASEASENPGVTLAAEVTVIGVEPTPKIRAKMLGEFAVTDTRI